MTYWQCEYCGDVVRNDEAGYNFFESRYFCNPDCAAKYGLDMDAEYDEYGDLK
jgi:hypothetical protein